MRNTPTARLKSWRRAGNHIYFSIGQADDFYATLEEFKARVPSSARRYFSSDKEWRVDDDYEYVLEELFDNYAAISSANVLTRAYASRSGSYRKTKSSNTIGWWLLGIAVVAFFIFFIWQPFQSPAAPSPPTAVTQPSATPTERPTATPRPSPSNTPVAAANVNQLTPARVTYVVDGDTIEVSLDGRTYRLRYIGMDTPERDERFYRESTNRNRQLVGGQTVYLEKDVSETDRYGRLLRYVYLADGRMVNEVLVQEGLAQVATFPPDVRYVDRFRAAQRAAEQAGRGMWGG